MPNIPAVKADKPAEINPEAAEQQDRNRENPTRSASEPAANQSVNGSQRDGSQGQTEQRRKENGIQMIPEQHIRPETPCPGNGKTGKRMEQIGYHVGRIGIKEQP
ncbi:hypothetical protein D1872_238230 [compost metagenome]